jgi:hypothetical protein
MRRLGVLLAIPLLFVAFPAHAQQTSGTPQVTLRLLHQTRWNDPDHTVVKVDVRAVNRSDQTLRDLSIFLGINTPTGSRTEYEQSLTEPTGAELLGNTLVKPGTLVPGARVTYRLTQDVSTLANIGGSAVYPMVVQLRSGDVTLATLRSPVIFLARNPPLTPLDLSWSFVLSAPITYGPDGFHSSLLQKMISPRQPLREELDALLALASSKKPKPFDVAIAPQLVDQLATMSRGYTLTTGTSTTHIPKGTGGSAEAARALFELRSITAGRPAEVSALPFSSPSIPALMAGGLGQDLPEQLARGRQIVQTVLGHDPTPGVMHPPGSRLDQASLFALQQNGIHLLLVDSNAVHQPQQQLGFAKPAVVGLSTGTSTPVEAVVPDSGIQALLDGNLPSDDSHLAVQVILGELAQVWLEQPSFSRGIALTVSERSHLPGSFFGPFIRTLAVAPFLHPRKAVRLADAHPPPSDTLGMLKPAAAGMRYSSSYLSALRAARQSIGTYTSILARADATTTGELDRLILLAESGQFLTRDDGGMAFLSSVTDRLRQQFQAVTLDTSDVVTLTSRSGTIPIPIHNATGRTVKVRVDLEAGGRLSVEDNARLVTVPPDGVTLPFRVQAQTTGRFPVQIQVLTPDGHTALGPPAHLVIRSTAYNRVALVLTIGAALVLLALWGRRFMPWTKR